MAFVLMSQQSGPHCAISNRDCCLLIYTVCCGLSLVVSVFNNVLFSHNNALIYFFKIVLYFHATVKKYRTKMFHFGFMLRESEARRMH